MYEIVNKLLLAGDKLLSEMHLRQPATFGKPGLTYIALVDHLLKPKREYKNLKRQEIQDIFIKTS